MATKVSFYEDLTNTIIEALSTGVPPWEKPWFSSKPVNAVSGKAYSGINHLNLNLAASKLQLEKSDLRFMTFNQARDRGYKIKRGSKAIAKVVYFSTLEREEEIENNTTNEVSKTVSIELPYWKYSPVFHASQVEGIPEYLPTVHFEANEVAERIVQNSKAKIIAHPNRAYYSPGEDLIAMPSIESFKSKEGYYGTLLHELGHWTGHTSRLNRQIKNGFGTELYAQEELVAELASVFLCAETGIQYQAGNHQAYIKNWIQVLKNDTLEIKRASAQAMKVVSYLLDLAKNESIEV